jgi:mannose-1-phosphate guanylyltransferase / phosphomannomutase
VERVFFREDYRRVYLEDIGNIEYAQDAGRCIRAGYLERSTPKRSRRRAFKVVVDYAHAPAADVLPDLLDGLGLKSSR